MHKTRVDSIFLILLLYLHEQRGLHGMKQTYPQLLVFILHCYHIKGDNFRHSQQDRNNPNQNNFGGCPRWNPGAFDLIPGYDSPVSVKINGTMLRLRGLFICNNDTFIHWFQHISRAYAKQFYLLDKMQILYGSCILLQHTRQWWLFLHLSTLKAHRLSTVIPTDVFWRKGTSLHSLTPNGQSSAMSCNRKKRANFFQWEKKSVVEHWFVIVTARGGWTHPVCIDRNVNHNVDQIPHGQTGDEDVGSTSHALVGIYDPQ